MVDSIVTGLLLAAVSGITFIAYKHPRGYRKLLRLIFIIGLSICSGLIGWMVAVKVSATTARRITTNNALGFEDRLDQLPEAINGLNDNLLYPVIGLSLVVLYLKFLQHLPQLLGLPTEKDPPPSVDRPA